MASKLARTTIILNAQTDWVDPGGQFKMTLTVHSDLPVSDLGLKLVLYEQLASVSAFNESLTGQEAAGELPLYATSVIPLDTLGAISGTGGRVSLQLRISTSASATGKSPGAPTLPLDCRPGSCAGVYPLEVAVIDTASTLNTPLASLTTHVCYISNQQGFLPLHVALVLPFGGNVALGSNGQSTLTSNEIASLSNVISAISTDSHGAHDALSLELYPQLLIALSSAHASRAVYKKLVSYIDSHQGANLEVLRAPFASVNPSTLGSVGLARDFTTQLARGISVLEEELRVHPDPNPYVAYGVLDNAALQLLTQQNVDEIIIPDVNVVNQEMTTPADPFHLEPSTQPSASNKSALPRLIGLVSNTQLGARFSAPGTDVVLAAHQFLAELAQIYFDLPGAEQGRGIVVAPQYMPSNTLFIRTVLNGLRSSTIVSPSTVGGLFSTLSVGANGQPAHLSLAQEHTNASSLSAGPIDRARSALKTLTSIAPSDSVLLTSLGDSVLLGESTNLNARRRTALLNAPGAELAVLRASLGLSGSKSITLTSLTGKIPITISYSGAPGPIHVELKLSSSELTLPNGASRELILTKKTTTLEIRVSTRTSGSFPLQIELTSPSGNAQLFEGTFTVRSRAVTGVAIALSLGALLVLALWWTRSVARHRRRVARNRASSNESVQASTP
jgi:hypothetical protein